MYDKINKGNFRISLLCIDFNNENIKFIFDIINLESMKENYNKYIIM